MIAVGQKVRCWPLADDTPPVDKEEMRRTEAYGEVVYVNEPCRWFSVVYKAGYEKLRTSFFFDDIGGKVILCG